MTRKTVSPPTGGNAFPHSEMITLMSDGARYDLAGSVGPSLSMHEMLSGASLAHLKEITLGYGSLPGHPGVRELVARSHGVGADEVILTVGGMHALFMLAFIVCGRGAEVVLTEPVFPLFRNCLDAVGASVKSIALDFGNGFQPELEEFSRKLTPETKIVCLASPQNPSGVLMSSEKIEGILKLMDEICPSAYLLIDETYRDACYESGDRPGSFVARYPKTISIGSMSKCHGAPGLRLGWILIREPELYQKILLAKFNTVSCCSRVDEELAYLMLKEGESYLARSRGALGAAREVVAAWVKENQDYVDWVAPHAGALCCIRLRPDKFDDNGLAEFYGLLAKLNVRVAPGIWFGTELRVFRLGFGALPVEDLRHGLMRTSRALQMCATS